MTTTPRDRLPIIIIIAVSLIIGVSLFVIGRQNARFESPILISVFIGMGIAAVIYHFLGGLREASVNLGRIKLAGSVAAFLAVSYFLNRELVKQQPQQMIFTSKNLTFTPENWFPVDKKSGEPITLKIASLDSIITIEPYKPSFPKRDLVLNKRNGESGNYPFLVKQVLDNQDTIILGGLSENQLLKNKLFKGVTEKNDYLFTTRGVAPNQEVDIAPELPFFLRTSEYSQELSRFGLMDRVTRKLIVASSIYRRGGKIIECQGRSFLILVTEVDHQRSDAEGGPYAKFAVLELLLK